MARWSDLAEWRGPSPHITVDGMTRYDGQVTHIAEGYYEGTIAWQLRPRKERRTSAHFVVGREPGQCAQIVDLADAAWTQGAGNGEWVSIENAGFTPNHPLHKPGWEKLSDWQIECNARLFARGHVEFGWPLQLTNHPNTKGLGYHGMGAENGIAWGHILCPGEPIKAQQPLILARAIEIAGGEGMSQQTETDVLWAAGRIEAIARLYDTYQYGPEKGKEVPFTKVIKLIADKVGIDAAELAAITEAARQGAAAGVVDAADELVAAFVAALPDDVASRDDVVSALREVLTRGVGNPA